MTGMPGTELQDARADLLSTLARRAEQKAIVTTVAHRMVRYGHVPWSVIEASLATYRESKAVMLSARPAEGAISLDILDIALACRLGIGTVQPRKQGAKRRLRELLLIASALRRLGEGLRFGELLAATGLSEWRLAQILRWAERQGVLAGTGELGWFFRDSAELFRMRRLSQEGRVP